MREKFRLSEEIFSTSDVEIFRFLEEFDEESGKFEEFDRSIVMKKTNKIVG